MADQSLTAELEQTRKSVRQAAEIKTLRKELERVSEALLAERREQVKPPSGKPKPVPKGRFYRVIVPDSHGRYIDARARDAFLSDLEWIKPAQIVMLGDHLDCGGWLAQHHTLGFVPEASYTFEDDVRECNKFLNAIQKRSGRVPTWYIEGNHEQRIRKTILKLTLGNPADSEAMLKLWGAPHVLGLKERGIKWIESGTKYDGLHTTGIIRLGKCLFTHGRNAGVNAAQKTLSDFKANVCFGHTHRIATAMQESAQEPTLAAWSFGCLCQRVPLYADTRPTNWAHGYGLQVVDPGGRFFTIQVPIIDGVSLLPKFRLEASAA